MSSSSSPELFFFSRETFRFFFSSWREREREVKSLPGCVSLACSSKQRGKGFLSSLLVVCVLSRIYWLPRGRDAGETLSTRRNLRSSDGFLPRENGPRFCRWLGNDLELNDLEAIEGGCLRLNEKFDRGQNFNRVKSNRLKNKEKVRRVIYYSKHRAIE